MDITLRPGKVEDAPACGQICYEAFTTMARAHCFTPDFPSPAVATGLMTSLLGHPGFYSVVAEQQGRIVGSNFLDERNSIAGVGPITVDPSVQNKTTGRRLMDDVHDRAARGEFAGVRLVQAAYHNRSLALYAKLGYDVRETLSCIQGPALELEVPGHLVRTATERDLAACNRLCRGIHGHDRSGELADAIHQSTATVVEHDDRITGYATIVGFFGHAVAETNSDLKALIGAAHEFVGPGFLLPSRNGEVFRWCLAHGLRVMQPMTLMSRGLYNEPAGAFLPSILY